MLVVAWRDSLLSLCTDLSRPPEHLEERAKHSDEVDYDGCDRWRLGFPLDLGSHPAAPALSLTLDLVAELWRSLPSGRLRL
jgi:hypothetical protein